MVMIVEMILVMIATLIDDCDEDCDDDCGYDYECENVCDWEIVMVCFYAQFGHPALNGQCEIPLIYKICIQ